ncbi:MAG: hypothetical protein ACK6A8_02210 [Planctomycetota bacterium]
MPRHGEAARFWPSRKVLATPQGSAERDVSSLLDERLHDESLLGQAFCAIVDAGLAWLH